MHFFRVVAAFVQECHTMVRFAVYGTSTSTSTSSTNCEKEACEVQKRRERKEECLGLGSKGWTFCYKAEISTVRVLQYY